MDPAAALVFAADGAMFAASAFNAACLEARRRSERRAGRRTAAAVLATLSAGVAVEALFAQALFTTHSAGGPGERLYSPGVWIAARALLLAGTLMLSMLILRSGER
jgi:hypothetical protein